MKVHNPTDAGVFVKGYGVLAPGDDADIKQEVGDALVSPDGPLKRGAAPKPKGDDDAQTTTTEREATSS